MFSSGQLLQIPRRMAVSREGFGRGGLLLGYPWPSETAAGRTTQTPHRGEHRWRACVSTLEDATVSFPQAGGGIGRQFLELVG